MGCCCRRGGRAGAGSLGVELRGLCLRCCALSPTDPRTLRRSRAGLNEYWWLAADLNRALLGFKQACRHRRSPTSLDGVSSRAGVSPSGRDGETIERGRPSGPAGVAVLPFGCSGLGARAWRRPDSNGQPSACKAGALPVVLLPRDGADVPDPTAPYGFGYLASHPRRLQGDDPASRGRWRS